MLNWTVFNRTDYLHKNGFGVKLADKCWYVIKPTKPTIQLDPVEKSFKIALIATGRLMCC